MKNNQLFFIFLFVGIAFFIPKVSGAQQLQKITPLPTNQWKKKKDFGEYLVGTFYEKVSTRTELISFYAYLESDFQSTDKWRLLHYSPNNDKPLVVMEEKRPLEYFRLESHDGLKKDKGWKKLGPWTSGSFSVPAENLSVLIQYQGKDGSSFFCPAFVYHNDPPDQIRLYRATISAGEDLKGGVYTIYDGRKKLYEGKIGQQLGGATFSIRIPVDKMPKEGKMLRAQVQLVEVNKKNGPELVFEFYHQPYQP